LEGIAETDWFVEASGEWLLAYRQLVLVEPKLELYREFLARASTIASAIRTATTKGTVAPKVRFRNSDDTRAPPGGWYENPMRDAENRPPGGGMM
jgi:hypothetical protein